MRKVLVIGSGGSGKSTFSNQLGQSLRIDVVHLDQIYWKPGWVETSKDEWLQTIAELVARDSWVMDGNYSGSLEKRLEACDTVIFLDLPRSLCLWRVLKRAVIYRNSRRPDMAEGCEEQLNLKFVWWIWNYGKKTRPGVLERLNRYADTRKVVRLRSRLQVEKFLAELHPSNAG